jgi:hypothetical protein
LRSPLVGEEVDQRFGAFQLADAHDNFVVVGETRVGTDVVQRAESTGLRVHRPVYDTGDSRLLGGSGAHHTRFESDDQRAVIKPPRAQRLGRIAQRQDFCVGHRVIGQLPFVVAAGQYIAVRADDERTDGHVVMFECHGCLAECELDQFFERVCVVHAPNRRGVDGFR